MKILIITLSTYLLIFGLMNTSSGQTSAAMTGYKIGDIAADFSLKNVDGKEVSLKSFKKAKGYCIIFTCNHCPFSVKYEDRIIALNSKYKKLGIPIIAINPNDPEIVPEDSFEAMKVRSDEKKFKFPYLYDDGQKVMMAFGAKKTPHVFLLDKNRKVIYIGGIDNNADEPSAVDKKYTENAIEALLAGKDPNPSTTKAIGCSVKVKKK